MGVERRQFIAGVMIGSSADGVDVVCLELNSRLFQVISFATLDFPIQKQQKLSQLSQMKVTDLIQQGETLLELRDYLTSQVIEALDQATKGMTLDGIGVHGYTLLHDKSRQLSWQLINENMLAKYFDCPVISDFRQDLLEAGGMGAPLIPLFHYGLFQSLKLNSVSFFNIGGMSNISYLTQSFFHGWDLGPGNCIMDLITQHYFNSPYDRDGVYAAQGQVNQAFYKGLVDKIHKIHAHFPSKQGYPTSFFVRGDFPVEWVSFLIESHDCLLYDALYTAAFVTADCIKVAMQQTNSDVFYGFGGGIYNNTMINILAEKGCYLETQLPFGLTTKNMEATCFAWLAYKRLFSEELWVEPLTVNKKMLVGRCYHPDECIDLYSEKISMLKI